MTATPWSWNWITSIECPGPPSSHGPDRNLGSWLGGHDHGPVGLVPEGAQEGPGGITRRGPGAGGGIPIRRGTPRLLRDQATRPDALDPGRDGPSLPFRGEGLD